MTAGAVFQACAGPNSPSSAPPLPQVSGTLVNRSLSINVDASSPLAAVGGAAIIQAATGTYLIAHTSQNAFTALTALCTHADCNVTGFANSVYVCPCHGSEFNLAGGVVQGPAPVSLRQFPTTFANNVVTISV